MLKRIPEIESAIRDSIQCKIEVQYSQFSNETYTGSTVKLTFTKFEKELIELVLFTPTSIEWFDEGVEGECISHIKAFKNDGGVEISLDPYDERVGEIEDRDNYVFKAKDYEINATKI